VLGLFNDGPSCTYYTLSNDRVVSSACGGMKKEPGWFSPFNS
jgi:hypothetical protein